MNYNDVLNSVADRMGQATTTSRSKPPTAPTQTTIDNLLNKIGLEVQRQGGTR